MSEEIKDQLMTADNNILKSGEAIHALTKAEIDTQIATAKAYPRDIKTFLANAKTYATLDVDTAASMFYTLPRAGKTIQGASIRLAEIVQYCWKNARSETNIESIDEKTITAVGSFFDLENNIATRVRVKRKITDKNGKRYSDDMITVTGNAAMKIALRQAVFAVVPKSLIDLIYEDAKKVAIGTAETLAARREKAIQRLEKIGVRRDEIFAKLGRNGIESVTLEDLEILFGVFTAIKQGEITPENAFALDEKQDSDKTTDLNETLNQKKQKQMAQTALEVFGLDNEGKK